RPVESVTAEPLPTNYKSLDARRRALEDEARDIRSRMESVEVAAREATTATPESGDALDVYMASNEAKDGERELEVWRIAEPAYLTGSSSSSHRHVCCLFR